MAPCCTNIVTPKMIRSGQVKIGDRIQLEDILASTSAPAPSVEASAPAEEADPSPEASVVSAPGPAAVQNSAPAPEESIPAQARFTQTQQPQQMNMQPMQQPQGMNMQPQGMNMQPQQMNMQPQQMNMQPMQQNMQNQQMGSFGNHGAARQVEPINYGQMTPYLDQVRLQSSNNPLDEASIVLPQTPMTGQDFTETIDINDMLAFTGFLRTQIGRYMRVEQLIGSNIVEDRFGFLVGIGTNFIILQEITTGNIMVLDLFTIRMTYIYYSQPIFPEL